ncbi:hypothetical protein ACKWTF_006315 [Chironomus riparius]
MGFFETFYYKSLLKDTSKVAILKFETSNKPSASILMDLSQKCLGNSIVILLAIDGRKKFHLYWKSKQIKHFLTFKIYDKNDFMNDIRLFEFLADFLAHSMKRGHLGLHSKVPIKPTVNTFEFHLLADHRDFNLLLVAAEAGDAHVVSIMLNLGFSSEFREVNAQTLAWKNRHFEVLSLLLKSNLIYPYSIYIDECPDDIKEFFEVSRELNEVILIKNEARVLEILSENSDMIHFYNLNNESALAFALNHRLFDMYRLLISKNIMLGPHERFSEIKEDMKESEREKLREIHYKESKILPDNHMHVLLSNSRLGHDSSNVQRKFKIIQNAFEILNGNPFVQIILKIVAASRNFRIIFDFNRDSVEVVDPTVDESTDGLFYLSGRIYIGAKKLLDKDMKFEALGVLAHELCHYAVSLVYKNSAKPYFANDSKTKKVFGKILKFCVENAGNEQTIDVVHKLYHATAYHAELIVRVPHLIMKYLNNPEKFNSVRSTFHTLFDIYEDKIFKEMKEALPRIEAKAESEKEKNRKKIRRTRIISSVVVLLCLIGVFATRMIFYKPIYKFAKLSREDQIRVENAPVIYMHVDLMFRDLFPLNSSAYYKLSSDDISQMLDENPLDLSDLDFFYLNKLIFFKWMNLTTVLKDKFLASNLAFQNEILTYKMMNISDPEVFNSLTSDQIIDVLSGEILPLSKMIQNKAAFYTERSMFPEFIYAVYFKFMVELNGGKTQLDCNYRNTTGTADYTFKEFYKNFTKLNFNDIISKINIILHSDYYSRCFVSGFKILDSNTTKIVDSLLHHKFLQKGFDKILIESGVKSKINSSRIFILSADAGTGKTETFRQFALRIKKLYPTQWVSYIDYRQHKEFYNITINNIEDAKKALARILRLNFENEFEKKIFDEYFSTGRMILLWDGFDQICPEWFDISEFSALRILELTQMNTTNIQFVSTRPLYSYILRNIFKIEPYTFVPFSKASQIEFLRGFFVSKNITKTIISTYIDKVQRIVNSTKSKNDFDTPLPLGMIANIISNDKKIFKSGNLYQIYQKVVEDKLLLWLNNINGERNLIEALLMHGISVAEIYQKYALRIIPNNKIRSFSRFLSLKLKITTEKFPRKIKIKQISEMGILFINDEKTYSFAHSTFIEFFIAQYIIHNVYKTNVDIFELEAEMRIQLFYWSIQDSGISIFIESYLQTLASDSNLTFNPQITNLFLNKYSNFMLNMLQSRTASIPLLINFFKKDHTILTHQLQFANNDGVYASTFNYAHFNIYNYDELNRSDIIEAGKESLNGSEYENFISLQNHKGIILYSMYCIKQFHNSSEYARKSIPDYDLSDEIFDSYNVSKVLTSVANNVTSKDLTKLLTSETVWYRLSIINDINKNLIIFKDNDLEFYETLWDLVETNINDKEKRKKWILRILKFPFLLKNDETRTFLLNKVSELLLNHEIIDRFAMSFVLHFTATIGNTNTASNQRFNYSWNFLVSHTNTDQQKKILKRLGNVECYFDHKFINFCYLVPKIYLLQASLIENLGCDGCNSSELFHTVVEIYETYFNKSELQDLIITGPKDFIPFLIIVRSSKDCEAYADFLKMLFKGNEASLRKFLSDPVEPTMLNVFELFSNLYYSQENFEIFKRLIKGLQQT